MPAYRITANTGRFTTLARAQNPERALDAIRRSGKHADRTTYTVTEVDSPAKV